MRLVFLLSALYCSVAAECEDIQIPCVYGDGGIFTKDGQLVDGMIYYKQGDDFLWAQDMRASMAKHCAIAFNKDCEVRMIGMDPSNKYNFEKGCESTEEGYVYCYCRDREYCNMDADKYVNEAQKALQGQDPSIRLNCPNFKDGLKNFNEQPKACKEKVVHPEPKHPNKPYYQGDIQPNMQPTFKPEYTDLPGNDPNTAQPGNDAGNSGQQYYQPNYYNNNGRQLKLFFAVSGALIANIMNM